MEVGDKVFRYETYRGYGTTYLRLDTYTVSEVTPCGYWIREGHIPKAKWINGKAQKRFAYPNKEMALNAYRLRKFAFQRHARRLMKFAEHDLAVIETEAQKVAAMNLEVPECKRACSVSTARPQFNLFGDY